MRPLRRWSLCTDLAPGRGSAGAAGGGGTSRRRRLRRPRRWGARRAPRTLTPGPTRRARPPGPTRRHERRAHRRRRRRAPAFSRKTSPRQHRPRRLLPRRAETMPALHQPACRQQPTWTPTRAPDAHTHSVTNWEATMAVPQARRRPGPAPAPLPRAHSPRMAPHEANRRTTTNAMPMTGCDTPLSRRVTLRPRGQPLRGDGLRFLRGICAGMLV